MTELPEEAHVKETHRVASQRSRVLDILYYKKYGVTYLGLAQSHETRQPLKAMWTSLLIAVGENIEKIDYVRSGWKTPKAITVRQLARCKRDERYPLSLLL